jgi:(p)ppGpp synthase/HD superfamily hydrolase
MKKSDNRSFEKTVEFAERHYEGKKTPTGGPLFEHCMKVARQAEKIAQKLYQDVRADFLPDSTKDSIAMIMQSAVLHDVLNVSACAFEHIAETATVQVAAMVADISRDFRLVETKRDMEFRGRLSQSPVGAQIVVAADIICTAKELLALLQTTGPGAVPRAKKILAQLDGDLLALHAANRYYMLRLYVHAARNLLVEVSQKIKECKQQARMEKLVAQHTKKLREKIENDRPVTPKKKEMRYARKRSADADSQ